MDLKLNEPTDRTGTGSGTGSPPLKTCGGCQTTTTPLWRGGPDGPKSLCNACGIKYNKRRRQFLGVSAGKASIMRKKRSSVANRSGEILKRRFRVLGSDVVLQRSGKLMSRLREEEMAAMVLMALSCGSVVCA